MTKQLDELFTLPLLAWYDCFGRKDLPWQNPRNPYTVWISEIMLQQTQVKTVIPYFLRFVKELPHIFALANAEEDHVLALWSGLGYYSRARNLLKTAKIICETYQGQFPPHLDLLVRLPGIGASTAAAIASQAFNLPTAILDANVKRVLCRYFLIEGNPEKHSVKSFLWELAKRCMSTKRCADYTQAIMDFGAICCTPKNPNCENCPLANNCSAKLTNQVALYPSKKLKKVLPHKEEQFLLLYTSENKIYLEKRPPLGIWGGLWCMPSINRVACPKNHVKNFFNYECLAAKEIMQIKHSFSHFHLHIKAISLLSKPLPGKLYESPGRWFNFNEITNLGLAKPILQIIKKFLEKLL